MSLSVLVPTRDPAPRIAALLAPLREIADEIVIAVDHRVDLDRLGAYERIADRLLRFEHTGDDIATGWLHRQCTAEWVLTLAGDEVPSAALVAALPALCADPVIRQYWLPVRWVWPDPQHWLDELPWSPDFHNRLLRNDDHLWFEGRTHGGAWPVLPARYVEPPIYHLDGVLLSESERAEKARRYAALRPGLTAPGGGELNERYYLPERHARLPLADVPAEDRERLAAVAEAPPGVASGPPQGPVAVGLRADFEPHRAGAALSEADYAASVRLLERDHRMVAGETRNVFAAVRNLGSGDVAGRHQPAARDPDVLPLARRRRRDAHPRRPPHPLSRGSRARRGVRPPGRGDRARRRRRLRARARRGPRARALVRVRDPRDDPCGRRARRRAAAALEAVMTLRPSQRAPNLIAGDGVAFGEGAVIGANVVLYDGTVLEPGCEIEHGAVIGKPPRLGPHSTWPRDLPQAAVIGAGAAVGCGAVVCAGARIGPGAVVGDHALVRERAVIGAESVIGHASSVGRGAVIGERVRIMSGVAISPATRVEDDVFIAPLAMTVDDATGGRRRGEPTEVVLRRGCRIGAAAVVLPGVEIGEDAFVGAGAIVARSVPAGMLVRGEPARVTGEAPGR